MPTIDVAVTTTPQRTNTSSAPPPQAAPTASVATDQEWITYPPFPKPPPGVTIIPFKAFRPQGIYASEDVDPNAPADPEHVERDALGVPTVTLAVKHGLTEAERRRKVSKRLKTRHEVDGIVRRQMWYEEWETGENLRRMIAPIDPLTTRADRLHQASQDFRAGRPWPNLPTGVPQLWDSFRLYVGIISSIQPAPGVKRMKQLQALAEAVAGGDSDDSDDDDLGENDKAGKKQVVMVDEEGARAIEDEKLRGAPPRKNNYTEEERELQRENFRERKASRMDAFFNDTEECIKVFFSSYFRDKGLIWSEQRVRDGPILVEFFLNFILRNRVLPEPEHEKGLRKALLVAEQARKELPQTFVVGKALPDAVGAGCEALWGSRGQTNCWPAPPDAEASGAKPTDDTEEPDAKRRKLDEQETETLLKEVVGDDSKIEVLSPETVAAIEKVVQKAEATVDANGASDGVWGNSGWGDNDNANGDGGNGWGGAETDPWGGDGGSTWDAEPKPNPLMAHMGATLLPLTHTVGVVERSTRRIASIAPAPGLAKTKAEKKKLKGLNGHGWVENDLDTRFAKMTLAPWGEWDTHERTDIMRPRILESSRGPVAEDDAMEDGESAFPKPHNPYKDQITVLLDSPTAEKMLLGMGLDGTWVQIVRQDPDGSGKEEIGDAGQPTCFWYVEQLTSTLPSFHTEAYY